MLYIEDYCLFYKNDTLIHLCHHHDRVNDLMLRSQQYIYRKELHLQWTAPSG